MPGLYEYRRPGDNRVEGNCYITLNYGEDNATGVRLSYGEPFTVSFFTYHEVVLFYHDALPSCGGRLYRIGD